MTNFAVYCSASPESTEFNKAGKEIAKFIVEHDGNLVYGGSNVGLMKVTAAEVHNLGGKVYGVIPRFMEEEGLAYEINDQTFVVDTMQQRKKKMFELADVCIALPGGVGTLEEITEIMSWDRIGVSKIPYFFYNYQHFYDHLAEFIDNMVKYKLLMNSDQKRINFFDDLKDADKYLANYQSTDFKLFNTKAD